jgi:hypothetical protein
MKTIKKIKNLRPIDVDVNFKYVCPNCCLEHWVTLKQVQYNKFVIVCDCDVILKPKTVEKIRTVYHKKNVKSKVCETTIDSKLLNLCKGTILINLATDIIVDSPSLLSALNSKKIIVHLMNIAKYFIKLE